MILSIAKERQASVFVKLLVAPNGNLKERSIGGRFTCSRLRTSWILLLLFLLPIGIWSKSGSSQERRGQKALRVLAIQPPYDLYLRGIDVERAINLFVRLGFPIYRADETFTLTDEASHRQFAFGRGAYLISCGNAYDHRYLKERLEKLGVPWAETRASLSVWATKVPPARIAVYNGTGNNVSPIESFGRCLERLGFSHDLINLEDIRMGRLANYDLLVMSGGDEPWYGLTLRGEGNKAIRDFLQKGGRYMAACAGAYFASRAPVGERPEALAYGLKEVPKDEAVEFLNILDFSCRNNIPWDRLAGYVGDQAEFLRHGSREIGFERCWYSDYAEIAQIYPFRIESRPRLTNCNPKHPAMYNVPETLWSTYAGGPLMVPAAGSVSLADFIPEVLLDDTTFDPARAKELLSGTSAMLEGGFGLGKGLLFSCHPEHDEDTYLLVSNAIRYLANDRPETAAFPAVSARKAPAETKIHLGDLGRLRQSLDAIRIAAESFSRRGREHRDAMPEPLKPPMSRLLKLLESKTTAIISDVSAIHLMLEGPFLDLQKASPEVAYRLESTTAELISAPKLLRTIAFLFERATKTLGTLNQPASAFDIRLKFVCDYYFFFLGKEDILGAGGEGINKWVPGIGDRLGQGILPALHVIRDILSKERELLEYLSSQERRS
jgi:hypothetical protein